MTSACAHASRKLSSTFAASAALSRGAQTLREAEQRPAVPGIAAQILAVDLLGGGRAARLQQHGAERMERLTVPPSSEQYSSLPSSKGGLHELRTVHDAVAPARA